MQGWLFCKNIDCSFLEKAEGSIKKTERGTLYTNIHSKFSEDTIDDGNSIFLEGYITNKKELLDLYEKENWFELYSLLVDEHNFPNNLRGSFSGFRLAKEKNIFFTDHIGSKALFYYKYKNVFIVSTKLLWIAQVLQVNNVEYSFNELAAKYMMTYGFMLDNSTFVSEIKRVLPGQKIIIRDDDVECIQYYMPTINNVEEITEEEAVERIDTAFRKAIKREFEKDREYGYKHLVDLSGGLDSRMVTWVAHEMGYKEQTNISYCKAGYLDFAISSEIAKDLKHEYYFKQLDDFQWIYDLENILRLNNGMAIYSGITGGKDCLSNINNIQYGIEHTGMIGDVIVSCFSKDKGYAYKKPEFGTNQYSTKLKYKFSEAILNKYENQEIFDLCVRGFLGAMSTYSIRQNCFEVSSPFLDVDFMEECFRVPIEYRMKHKLYLKWIEKYYNDAARYGWEKWAGALPKKNMYPVALVKFVLRKFKRIVRDLLKRGNSDSMNPFDFWYSKDEDVQCFFESYYKENIKLECIGEKLREDIITLFETGTTLEKTQVLTVLGMAKLYFYS